MIVTPGAGKQEGSPIRQVQTDARAYSFASTTGDLAPNTT